MSDDDQGELAFLEEEPELADRPSVREAKAIDKRKVAARIEMVRAVVGMPEGRAWLREIIFTWCHVNTSSLHENPAFVGFNEGERNIGQRLIADIVAASPADYLKILQGEKDA